MTEANKAPPNTDDPEYQRQLKKLIEMLEEGVADARAGLVYSAEEVEKRLDEHFAKRAAERRRKAAQK
jgi:predicted transcriptional regulator